MLLTITQRAMSRITAHGLNVYPLEGFGVLLGPEPATVDEAQVLAALPVGKTERWYEPAGRFASVEDAVATASSTFRAWRLSVIGIYCTLYSSFGTYPEDVCASAPHLTESPWLVLRGVDGGETIFGSSAYRWQKNGWSDEDIVVVSPRVEQPERNPRRIKSVWNRTWGVLDYGNRHETELPRLGLPLPKRSALTTRSKGRA